MGFCQIGVLTGLTGLESTRCKYELNHDEIREVGNQSKAYPFRWYDVTAARFVVQVKPPPAQAHRTAPAPSASIMASHTA